MLDHAQEAVEIARGRARFDVNNRGMTLQQVSPPPVGKRLYAIGRL